MWMVLWALACGVPAANGAGQERDVELASALVRRGWIELAEELCDRIERTASPGGPARESLPLVQAELAVAKARRESDLRRAQSELDRAASRLRRADRAATLDERGMMGWLLGQKARLLSQAAEQDAAWGPEALRSWEAAASFYRASIPELEKFPPGRSVEDAILEARLEIPKALAEEARVPSIDPGRRRALLEESVRLLSDFQLGLALCPVQLEALFEEGRSRADLGDRARAERCFRGMSSLNRELRKAGFSGSDYAAALLAQGALALARTLTQDRRPREAVAVCDDFLNDHSRDAGGAAGPALLLARADALFASGDEAGAFRIAEDLARRTPESSAGRMARDQIARWISGRAATPDRLLLVAQGCSERGDLRAALAHLRRAVEACATPLERARVEPIAALRRGECFQSLGRDPEASAAFQEVFRRHPAHPEARRAAFLAVRCLSRASLNSRDAGDQEQMERLLGEVELLGLEGPEGDYLKILRADILERKGEWKAAADRYLEVGPACPAFAEAMVSAGHCCRREAESRWEPGSRDPSLREQAIRELGRGETALGRAVEFLEKAKEGPSGSSPLLATACLERAAIGIHELVGKPGEALAALERCKGLVAPESPGGLRRGELEIEAMLLLGRVDAAAARLDEMLPRSPESPSTLRSLRRVATRLAATDPGRAAGYDRAWLDRWPGPAGRIADLVSVADQLYRAARRREGLDDKTVSVSALPARDHPDRPLWKDAGRAHELLVRSGKLSGPDEQVAATRLAWCLGWSAESPDEWARSKGHCEKLLEEHGLLGKDGSFHRDAFETRPWLASLYLEYGHSLYRLGRGGQKFQYGNGLTVFGRLVESARAESEIWWRAQYLALRCLFDRGGEGDLPAVEAAISLLEGNRPGYDGDRYGMKSRFLELREEIRQAVRPRR